MALVSILFRTTREINSSIMLIQKRIPHYTLFHFLYILLILIKINCFIIFFNDFRSILQFCFYSSHSYSNVHVLLFMKRGRGRRTLSLGSLTCLNIYYCIISMIKCTFHLLEAIKHLFISDSYIFECSCIRPNTKTDFFLLN